MRRARRSEGTVDEWEALLDAREALREADVGAIKANLELLESPRKPRRRRACEGSVKRHTPAV